MIGRAGFWLAGVALLAATLAGLAIGRRLQIHSDLVALLPAPQRDPVKAAAMERIAEMAQRRLVVLVGAGNAALCARDGRRRAVLARSEAFIEILQRTDDLLNSTLQTEAGLVQALGGPTPVAKGSAITSSFPTLAEQRRDYARLARTLYAPDGPVQQLLNRAGYSGKHTQAHCQTFAAQQGRVLNGWRVRRARVCAGYGWAGSITSGFS